MQQPTYNNNKKRKRKKSSFSSISLIIHKAIATCTDRELWSIAPHGWRSSGRNIG
jgi:hypothetical protein